MGKAQLGQKGGTNHDISFKQHPQIPWPLQSRSLWDSSWPGFMSPSQRTHTGGKTSSTRELSKPPRCSARFISCLVQFPRNPFARITHRQWTADDLPKPVGLLAGEKRDFSFAPKKEPDQKTSTKAWLLLGNTSESAAPPLAWPVSLVTDQV